MRKRKKSTGKTHRAKRANRAANKRRRDRTKRAEQFLTLITRTKIDQRNNTAHIELTAELAPDNMRLIAHGSFDIAEVFATSSRTPQGDRWKFEYELEAGEVITTQNITRLTHFATLDMPGVPDDFDEPNDAAAPEMPAPAPAPETDGAAAEQRGEQRANEVAPATAAALERLHTRRTTAAK